LSVKNSFTEKKFQEVKQENSELSNEQIFGNIDNYFKEKLSNNLLKNLVQGEIAIKELKVRNNIKIELQKIHRYVSKINILEILDNDKEEIRVLLNSISTESKSKENQF
jgi:hypothetical protein